MVKKGWLLISYTVPAKPVNNRMKIWRRLAAAGAVQIKGAVYLLPYSDEHYELFQWLTTEVSSLGGEGIFARVPRIENMKENEIIALFDRQRDEEYRKIENVFDDSDQRISSIRKGGFSHETKGLAEAMAKARRDFEDIRKRDFFASKAGSLSAARLKRLEQTMRETEGGAASPPRGNDITLARYTGYHREIQALMLR